MKLTNMRLFWGWCRARRFLFLYVALVFGFFFAVYGLYGYEWGVAGYAALLGLATGLLFAGIDFLRWAARARTLAKVAGRFPTAGLPEPADLLEEHWLAVVQALEAERGRLLSAGEDEKRDAQEYYTLWVHQIKTPIAAMRLLLQSAPPGSLGPASADVEMELFRIEQYVGMVLQYQRLSSLSGDLVLQEFEVETLVKRAAKNLAPLFIYKRLPFAIEEVRGSVVTDAKWFVFVLEQVLTNALKYTAEGGVKVYSEGTDTLVIEDTGIGIAAAEVPRVFQRGFTGAAGRSERSSTGIGLYLCREILQRLGFGITLESTPGQGTRVLLDLHQTAVEVE